MLVLIEWQVLQLVAVLYGAELYFADCASMCPSPVKSLCTWQLWQYATMVLISSSGGKSPANALSKGFVAHEMAAKAKHVANSGIAALKLKKENRRRIP